MSLIFMQRKALAMAVLEWVVSSTLPHKAPILVKMHSAPPYSEKVVSLRR
jgi:hypothetical protein